MSSTTRRSSGFTSATTSGTSGSMRNTAESMTFGPRRGGDRRPLDRDRVVDVDDHEVEAVEASGPRGPRRSPRRRRTGACGPRTATGASTRSRSSRNTRSSRMRSISWPTKAATPMTPRSCSSLRVASSSALRARTACSTSTLSTRHGSPAHSGLDINAFLDHARDPDRRRADHLDDALVRRPSNILATTPGFIFMPAPTALTHRDPGVMGDPAHPRSRPSRPSPSR